MTHEVIGVLCCVLPHVFMSPSVPELIVKISFVESRLITHPFGLEASKFLIFFVSVHFFEIIALRTTYSNNTHYLTTQLK
jgi:hypothetical protein